MAKKLLMGNEAIALGAIRAGVDVVSGYPGTPSTEVLETIARHRPAETYIEWSINEKAAMEVAAGAAYGHLWGTVQVVIGAELGALIAFGLARVLGHDVLRRVFGDRVDAGLLGSQNALTATVLASRLMPFVSFDMISYAAGLSRLHAWRFALATLAGIIPASFLLAHFGGEAVSGDLGRATWAVLGLGLLTGLPLLWVAMRQKPEKGNP